MSPWLREPRQGHSFGWTLHGLGFNMIKGRVLSWPRQRLLGIPIIINRYIKSGIFKKINQWLIHWQGQIWQSIHHMGFFIQLGYIVPCTSWSSWIKMTRSDCLDVTVLRKVVIFNDVLNTSLGLCDIIHLDIEKKDLLPPLHQLLFPASSKGSFTCIFLQTAWGRVYQ